MLTPNPELSSKCLDILEKAMSFYENTFSPYPYKAYTLVETQGAFPGALEAYSFATYGPHTLPGAVVHELAHTWWGGLVPCAYTRSMLDESLAEFSDFLYKQHLSAKLPTNNLLHDPFKVSLREDSKLSNPFNNISLADAHLTFDPFQSAVGYVKGPVVLEQLDIMLGREQMLKSLKSLILHHTLYASIEWKDLESVVHEVTGTSYRWFFEQWVERAGFPSLRLNSVQSKAVNGETEISGELIQDGNPYQLQVPLTLEVSSSPPIHTVIAVSGKTTSFSLRTRQHPIRLLLDPDTTLPLAAQSAEQAGSSPFVFSF